MLVNRDAKTIENVMFDDCLLSLEEFVAIARYHAKVEFSDNYRRRVSENRNALKKLLDSGVGVYGVNTGFGDNVRYRISEDERIKLQENIIRSHGTSVGETLSEEEVRCLFILLLANIGKGHSMVRIEVLEQIRTFLNEGIFPYVPAEGTIGGLSCQPYAAMTLMGEGRIWYNGQVLPAMEVLSKHGIEPIKLQTREGLPLLTCASGSVGTAMLAVYDFIMAMRHSDLAAALTAQALRTTDKAFDTQLLKLKNHKDTVDAAEYMQKLINGSDILEKARDGKVQDSVNMRLIPHVHGAAKRLLTEAYNGIMEEFYAVVDNPVFFNDGTAMMGSNWDMTLVETYCDSLAIVACNVAKLTEVHMERLVTPAFSGLPAFLVKNPGLNNGFMITQYVTAGLMGDIFMLSQPAGAFNASVSAGQETPLARDETAARKLRRIIAKLDNMISITIMTAVQAVDFLDDGLSPATKSIYDEIRKTVTFMENDDLIYERIEAMKELYESHTLLDVAQKEAGDFII